MTTNKRILGRGLTELLSGLDGQASVEHAGGRATATATVSQVSIAQLHPSRYQPRREIQTGPLQELADSVREQGILQPILVRKAAQPERYEIIAGERRWRAAQLAGLAQVPVYVREISDAAAMAMALIENIQREDLNPVEQAVAYKRLSEECTLTHEEIAAAVGKSRATVTNFLRLLQLEPGVKSLLEQGALEMGHARALLGVSGAQQVALGEKIAKQALSVRAAEALVRRQQVSGEASQRKANALDPDVVRLTETLSETLGTRVLLQDGGDGKGRLVIHYYSLAQLEGILGRLQ